MEEITYEENERKTVIRTMPDKNNTNLAKTLLFPCFLANSRLKYVIVRLHLPLPKIIENIGVLVADKSNGVFLD